MYVDSGRHGGVYHVVGVGGTCAFYMYVAIMLHSLSDNKFRNCSLMKV